MPPSLLIFCYQRSRRRRKVGPLNSLDQYPRFFPDPAKPSRVFFFCRTGCRLSAVLKLWEFRPVWIYCGALLGTFVPVGPAEVTSMIKRTTQRIGMCALPDGVQLAWAEAVRGPADQGCELDDPSRIRMGKSCLAALDPLLQATTSASCATMKRGCGMTDWKCRRPLLRAMGRGFGRPWSQWPILESRSPCSYFSGRCDVSGLCREHLERVSHLVLYGGYARGTVSRATRTKSDCTGRSSISLVLDGARIIPPFARYSPHDSSLSDG